MGQGERPSENGRGDHNSVIVAADTLNRMTVALTVVHGHVQLLQRRIHQGATPDHDALLRTLVQMEAATQAMMAELHALRPTVLRAREPIDRV
jgi:uncharacterized protein (DUF2342 family)